MAITRCCCMCLLRRLKGMSRRRRRRSICRNRMRWWIDNLVLRDMFHVHFSLINKQGKKSSFCSPDNRTATRMHLQLAIDWDTKYALHTVVDRGSAALIREIPKGFTGWFGSVWVGQPQQSVAGHFGIQLNMILFSTWIVPSPPHQTLAQQHCLALWMDGIPPWIRLGCCSLSMSPHIPLVLIFSCCWNGIDEIEADSRQMPIAVHSGHSK